MCACVLRILRRRCFRFLLSCCSSGSASLCDCDDARGLATAVVREEGKAEEQRRAEQEEKRRENRQRRQIRRRSRPSRLPPLLYNIRNLPGPLRLNGSRCAWRVVSAPLDIAQKRKKGDDSSLSDHDQAATKIASSETATVGTRSIWDHADLDGDEARTAKFMRLLGARKAVTSNHAKGNVLRHRWTSSIAICPSAWCVHDQRAAGALGEAV